MRSPLPIVTLWISLLPCVASAQWQADGAPVSTAVDGQFFPAIVSDGAGGAIIAWEDFRSGNADIYVQRLNALGVPQWTTDGVALCTALNDQTLPAIASDGAGGAIVVWEDFRSLFYDIYARRVTASGVPQWTPDGVALSTAGIDQRSPVIVSDGAGGAIAAWQSFEGGFDLDVYARRVDASGTPQWAANGVALCTAFNDQYDLHIVTDGASGAIVAWADYRGGVGDIYAQRVNALGTPQWSADGAAICTATNQQFLPELVSDGAGGAVVTWQDNRTDSGDIYAQRVNGSGVVQWPGDGIGLATVGNVQGYPAITSDGAGGAIVAWEDFRSGTTNDIYARRVTAAGSPLWADDGLAISTVGQTEYFPTLVPDGAGGAVIVWQDDRNYPPNYSDIYAQKVNAYGTLQWTINGVALCNSPDVQDAVVICSDGAGGAIATWHDYRNGFYTSDIFAQRVEGRYGYWGHPEPIVTSVADVPKDQGGRVAVNWTASGRDLPTPRAIDHYTIWRAVDAVPVSEGDGAPLLLTDIARVGKDTKGPVYASLTSLPGYYWELVGTQPAHGWPGYSFAAPTRADSVSGNTNNEYFMVAAHDQWDDYVAFASNVLSGHSVDNLAPAAPLFLVAQRAGADVLLHWNRVLVPDLRDYAVYRASSSGVTPVPINFLDSAADTVLVDPSAPTTALYYIVTAYDTHANQSPPSNEASVNALTGVDQTPPITALEVLDNHPNPFAGSTMMRVGLPRAGDVALEVYDVAGRRVRSGHSAWPAGWSNVPFDGRDEAGRLLPSGVYFYKVRAAGRTVTKKMVIAR